MIAHPGIVDTNIHRNENGSIDWATLLGSLAQQHRAAPGTFYTKGPVVEGSPRLPAAALKAALKRYGFESLGLEQVGMPIRPEKEWGKIRYQLWFRVKFADPFEALEMERIAAEKATETGATHGLYMYQAKGCRCDICKAAAREYSRKRREAALFELEIDPNDPRHGTLTGYNYGCRCDACKEARAEYSRQQIAERNLSLEERRARIELLTEGIE